MSYSHADEAMRDRLEIHLSVLKRQGTIEIWHDRRIAAGARLDDRIMAEVKNADIFLFLLSADFLASNYCYETEMNVALDRAANLEAVVIPIVLHNCDWLGTPLARFSALPKDGKPIAKFAYPEDGYAEVVEGIRGAVSSNSNSNVTAVSSSTPPKAPYETDRGYLVSNALSQSHRSSNLAIRKTFTDVEKHSSLKTGSNSSPVFSKSHSLNWPDGIWASKASFVEMARTLLPPSFFLQVNGRPPARLCSAACLAAAYHTRPI
jgi:hypothetical protein